MCEYVCKCVHESVCEGVCNCDCVSVCALFNYEVYAMQRQATGEALTRLCALSLPRTNRILVQFER